MELYCFHLPPQLLDPTFEKLLSHLDTESQDRIRRFRLPKDALRSLIGRLSPTWYLLKQDLIDSPKSTSFNVRQNGKPFLVTPKLDPKIEYNTSHDGELVLLGISQTDIGVDIMQIPNPEDIEDIQEGITDQLTLSERRLLSSSLSSEQRSRLISAFWTLKEGYVKATGDGVSFGLKRIDVDMDKEAKVHQVKVDGRDIILDGWSWDCGTTSTDGDVYACWSEFIVPFLGSS